jgi:DNA-binding transcriptional regulator YdaS (Cro superfamily)
MTPTQRAIEACGGPAKVAALLGVSVQAACFYRDGKRPLPVKCGATVEAASGVKRWELWPDEWHRIWPELVGAKGAPPIPVNTQSTPETAGQGA